MDLPRGQEQTPRVTSVPVKHLQPLCEAFDRTHLRGTVCWFPVRHAESDDSEERRSLFPRRPPLGDAERTQRWSTDSCTNISL